MKKIFLFIIFLLSGISGVLAQANDDKTKGRFYFQGGELQDVGDIKPAQSVTDTFWFENIGINPIIVKFVSAPAAFVSTDWSRDPVKNGQKGYVIYTVKPNKNIGPFMHQLFIQANVIAAGEKAFLLRVKGNVIKDLTKPAKKKKAIRKAAAK